MNDFPWILIGQLIGTSLAIMAFVWTVFVTVGRPLADNAWMASLARKRRDVEAVLREQVFKPDLDAAKGMSETLDRLIVSGERSEETLGRLEKRHDDVDRELRALPALAAAVDGVTSTLEQFTRDLNEVSGKLERFGGILDELRRRSS